METTYYESADGLTISKARALRELARHGVDDTESIAAFLRELGDKPEYRAQAVLDWLGY